MFPHNAKLGFVMIYRYKATIPGSKTFFREYEVRSEMKLFKLHDFLQNDLGFAPDQMVIFQGVDSSGRLSREYGLFDMGDGSMDSVSIEKTFSRGEKTLRYLYNLSKGTYLELTFLSEGEYNPRASYPRLVAEKGHNPEQFSSKYEDDDFTETVESASVKDADQDEEQYDEEDFLGDDR